VQVEPPGVADAWARSRPAVRAYAAARRVPGAQGLLRTVGPLWELRATAEARGAA
jgi:hypothetical protein